MYLCFTYIHIVWWSERRVEEEGIFCEDDRFSAVTAEA